MKNSEKRDRILFNLIGGAILGIFALICLLPFLMMVSGSFSESDQILAKGYSILPRGFTLDAYQTVMKNAEDIFIAYKNTIIYTVVGTAVGLFITAMTGYVLNRKDFAWRNFFSYLFYFTTLFSGGLVPSYILMLNLGMKNNPLANILPGLLSVFNILIMRNFMNTIPDAITESAKIDGANDFVIFIKLVLPLLKPALATVGLFTALSYWNSWYNCMLYITDKAHYTLQYYLYNMLNNMAELKRLLERGVTVGVSNLNNVKPTETVKLAMACIVTGPIIIAYPFVQKYFVKGVTIGAVKG